MTSDQPLVSVVMGVRNAASSLEATLQSLLEGQIPELEILVINDGSSDGSGAILARLAAADRRLRVHEQPAAGLTRALIAGCREARGTYIARQDAGDRSLPDRLARQVACLEADPGASFCSTHARFVVEDGATVMTSRIPEASLADGLTGPACHGSVLMRRSRYEQVGGYRSAFYYAQDIDLWSRLVETGAHRVVAEVLYEADLSPGSISGSRRREQEAFHRLIVGATQARRAGASEAAWLEKAEALSASCRTARRDPRREASGAYFIASCLAASHPDLSRRYLRRTLELDPAHLRARLRLLRSR